MAMIFISACGTKAREQNSTINNLPRQIPPIFPREAGQQLPPLIQKPFDPILSPTETRSEIQLDITNIKDSLRVQFIDDMDIEIDYTEEETYEAKILFPKNSVPQLVISRKGHYPYSKQYSLSRISTQINGDPLLQSDDQSELKIKDYGDYKPMINFNPLTKLREVKNLPLFRQITGPHTIYDVSKTQGQWSAYFFMKDIQSLVQARQVIHRSEKQEVEKRDKVSFEQLAKDLFSGTTSLPEVRLELRKNGVHDLNSSDVVSVERLIEINATEKLTEITEKK